jgi:hypothetical protein
MIVTVVIIIVITILTSVQQTFSYFSGDTIIITMIVLSRLKPALCPGKAVVGVERGVR